MWRPDEVGEVIAERVCDVRRRGRRIGKLTVSFGRPVRAKEPGKGDPFLRPVRIAGPGIERFEAVPGVDSLQALVLALEYATERLPHVARQIGARVDFLGMEERIVLARQGVSGATEGVLTVLLGGLKVVASILGTGMPRGEAAKKKVFRALDELGRTVGMTQPPQRGGARQRRRRRMPVR